MTGTKEQTTSAAKYYSGIGLSVMPVDDMKRPTHRWKEFQLRRASADEVARLFGNGHHGVGIVTGKVSGNLEVIDVDTKYDLKGDLWEEFVSLIRNHAPGLFERLVVARTVSGGYHVFYRCAGVQGNQKLAQRPATAQEAAAGDKVKVKIETRGEGGFVVAAPTPQYEFVQGDASSIPAISEAERYLLLAVARSLDEMPNRQAEPLAEAERRPHGGGASPGDDYNSKADVVGLLQRHGWTIVSTQADRTYLKRPGKTDSSVSANYHHAYRLFYVFSTSTEFEAEKAYSPFAVYTQLEHGGDYKAAARKLYKDGFGTRREGKAASAQVLSSPEWDTDEPTPLPDLKMSAPHLDESLLPEPWREWIADSAERLQCPPDFAATAAIVAAASLVGNRIRIRPKIHDPWLVVPNLWGAIVGPPSAMKTPAVNEALLFFREIADRERVRYEDAVKAAEFDRTFSEAKKAELTKKMRAAEAGSRETFRREYEALSVDEPKEKRLWTTDVTVEKLGELLNENPEGLLILRDELTGWFRMLERSGHEQDRAFYLETWNGEGSFAFDRIGRGKTHIKNLTVSILGTIQPAMIAPFLRGSLEGESDDGLIQRFQLLVYPEGSKEYRYIDRPPKGRESARQSFHDLYSAQATDVGAKRLQEEDGGHAFLQFDAEAQEFFQSWLADLETDLRSDTFETGAIESHFGKYRSLMPTLSLLFHLIDRVAGNTESDSVRLPHAELAAAWCGYLQQHAIKLYSAARFSELDTAREVLARIKSGHVEQGFTARDIYGNHWKRLSKPEDVKRGLEVLVDHGYLSPFSIDTGGRTKTRYAIHPSLNAREAAEK